MGDFKGGRAPNLFFDSLPKNKDVRVSTIALTGDLDFTLRKSMGQIMEPLSKADIAVIDVRTVKYIDSTFINGIVTHCNQMVERGAPFAVRLVGASPSIRRIFEIAQVDGLVEFWDSRREARSTRITER